MSKIIENYSLLQVIGNGQYGKVYKGLNIKNNNLVAIKVVKCEKISNVPKVEEFTMNEIQTLARIDNPNIVKFYEMLKTPNNYYFVYEFCNNGTLEDLLKTKVTFSEEEAIHIFKQLVNAYKTLVEEHIMHRDLKPANILLHNDQIKLADFGFCKSMNTKDDMTKTMVGSPVYMAPEILRNFSYNSKAEIWSLGCVFFELLFGECPYEDNSISDLINSINTKPVPFYHNIQNISKQTEDVLKNMLVKEVDKRIGWDSLFKNAICKDAFVVPKPSAEEKKDTTSTLPKRDKRNRGFKYILNERNKLFFLYQILSKVIEMDLSEETPVIAFVMMKFTLGMVRRLRENIIDNFKPNTFPQMRNTFEQWSTIPDTFEYKSFRNILIKELDMIESHYEKFKSEAQKYMTQDNIIPTDFVMMKEIEKSEVDLKFITKRLLKYVEDVKGQYFPDRSTPMDENTKKIMIHLNEVMDSIILDEFFEKFIDTNVAFEHQKYFEIVKGYSKENLSNIISSKIDFTNHRLKSY